MVRSSLKNILTPPCCRWERPGGTPHHPWIYPVFASGGQLPGTYRVDVYLNGQYMTSRDINFVAGSGTDLDPALTLKEYSGLGLNDKPSRTEGRGAGYGTGTPREICAGRHHAV